MGEVRIFNPPDFCQVYTPFYPPAFACQSPKATPVGSTITLNHPISGISVTSFKELQPRPRNMFSHRFETGGCRYSVVPPPANIHGHPQSGEPFIGVLTGAGLQLPAPGFVGSHLQPGEDLFEERLELRGMGDLPSRVPPLLVEARTRRSIRCG